MKERNAPLRLIFMQPAMRVDALEISNQTVWPLHPAGDHLEAERRFPRGDVSEQEVRHIYPAEVEPAALRVELAPASILRPRRVDIIAMDDPKIRRRSRGGEDLLSQTQAETLVRRLRGVLGELCGPQ